MKDTVMVKYVKGKIGKNDVWSYLDKHLSARRKTQTEEAFLGVTVSGFILLTSAPKAFWATVDPLRRLYQKDKSLNIRIELRKVGR